MKEMEQQLRQENTEYLQEKIRTNSYREDVAAIAKQVLIERQALVPVPETEIEAQEKVTKTMRLSNLAFFTVAIWIMVVVFFQPSGRNAVLFGLSLLPVFAYLKSKKPK